MVRDSPGERDKGTEFPSLSQDKGTTVQAQNLATGLAGRDFDSLSHSIPGRDLGPKKKERDFFFMTICF